MYNGPATSIDVFLNYHLKIHLFILKINITCTVYMHSLKFKKGTKGHIIPTPVLLYIVSLP